MRAFLFRMGAFSLPCLAVLGVGDTFLLLYNDFFYAGQCVVYGGWLAFLNGACDQVTSSDYSRLLGLPLAVWGFAFYLTLTVFFLLALFKKNGLSWYPLAAFLCLGAWIFSLWLFYVQWKVLALWCPLCLVSFTLVNGLLAVLLLMHFTVRTRPAFSTLPFFKAGILGLLIFLGVAGLHLSLELLKPPGF